MFSLNVDGITNQTLATATSIAVGTAFTVNSTSANSTVNTSIRAIFANGSIGTSGQVLTSNSTGMYWGPPPIGVNQTWQSYSSSRSPGTNYTNDTGRPIMVSVTANNSGIATLGSITATVSGVVVGRVSTGDDEGAQAVSALGCLTFIVPDGATYSIANTASTIQYWAELR